MCKNQSSQYFELLKTISGTFSNKRRSEGVLSPDYPTKRMLVSKSDNDYEESSYRTDHCDRFVDSETCAENIVLLCFN